MRRLTFAALVAVAALAALNWRAQLQTHQRLDVIAAALSERPAVLPPAPSPGPAVLSPKTEQQALPREDSGRRASEYTIEAPDVLTIEAATKDPKSGKVERLPGQPISGTFSVRPDGTVGLGQWGSVPVSGLAPDEASQAIRRHIADARPQEVSAESLTVSVGVLAYNSKRYYVITDGDSGDQVLAFPITTNTETVIDAIANVPGLPDIAGKRNIWVVRRTTNAGQPWQMLPVEWRAITEHHITATNYQIQPGDRVYVKRATN
jgi:polysaccharide export outer membrane protein